MDQPTLPPILVQAFADFSGSQPCPLQLFCPLQAFFALLQDPWPLQVLIPKQWTLLAAFAFAGARDIPLIVRAIAAAAMLLPEIMVIFILDSLGRRTRVCEHLIGIGCPSFLRFRGENVTLIMAT